MKSKPAIPKNLKSATFAVLCQFVNNRETTLHFSKLINLFMDLHDLGFISLHRSIHSVAGEAHHNAVWSFMITKSGSDLVKAYQDNIPTK